MTGFLTDAEKADAYILGLMDDEERKAFADRLETDTELARLTGAAQDRFLELDLAGSAAPVSSELWQRIEAGLEALPRDTAGAEEVPPPANDNRVRAAVTRWKLLALTGMAASVLLAAGLTAAMLRLQEPQVVAILMDAGGNPVVMIEDFGGEQAKVVPLADVSVPAGQSLEVWTLPQQAEAPVSMGVLTALKGATLSLSGLPEPQEEQLYEITFEPAGGSPTGRPTGPILGKGFARIPRS
ncbi:anti-sigma factor [Pannonibacter phragmitetus]|uniref:anti-sigma factor n=1 Tax=Pannonibacter phragmitetus TaxID=121719 RepID=UPI003D2EBA5C